MLTFHVIPLFLVIASEAWNLKVCACAMILDSSLRSATFRMTECQHYLVIGDVSHSVTVPRHRTVRVGTLNGIVADVAAHSGVTKDEVRSELFGS